MIRDVIKDDNNPFSRYLEYVEDEQVVAFLNYLLIYDKMEIQNLEVIEAYRNQKIGSELMNALIDIALKNNCLNITLEVRKSNLIAINLYHKYGFKEVAIRANYYGTEDGILMEKKL